MQARLAKLRELIAYDPDCPFEDALQGMTRIVGEMLKAGRVSLMLPDLTRRPRLRLAALYGSLPEAAWNDEAEEPGIAVQVLRSGCPQLVQDIRRSDYRDLARRPESHPSFLACPVPLAGEVCGVLNVSEPKAAAAFTEQDLELAELAAMAIGRNLQSMRLARMLDARFAQMALTREGMRDSRALTLLSAHEPERVARMLAKAFYREMRHCGFSPNQIIHAAGEILSELTGSLNRHKRRIARKT